MKYGMISLRGDKIVMMLPSEKDVQRIIKTLRKQGLSIKVEFISRCG